MTKKILILFLFSYLLLGGLSAQKGNIRGTLLDKSNNERIPFATISVVDTKNKTQFGGYTDPKGDFNIEKLNSGEYDVTFSYVGYETVVKQG